MANDTPESQKIADALKPENKKSVLAGIGLKGEGVMSAADVARAYSEKPVSADAAKTVSASSVALAAGTVVGSAADKSFLTGSGFSDAAIAVMQAFKSVVGGNTAPYVAPETSKPVGGAPIPESKQR